jgi:sec-independent protein translocase protein TatA
MPYLNVFLFGLGPMEILLIVVVVVLLFGGRKFPELMKGIGKGMKEFRKESDLDEETKELDKREKK